MYAIYRNSGARHTYETETEKEVTNLREVDTYIKRRTGLTNHYIDGANNTSVDGATSQSKLLKNIINVVPEAKIVKDFIDDSSKKEDKKL